MRLRFLLLLLVFCPPVFCPAGEEAVRLPETSLKVQNGIRFWVADTLPEGRYYLCLSYDAGKNGSERLARSLFLNGRIVEASRATAFRFRNGTYFVTMQSDRPYRIRKGDTLSLAAQQNGRVEYLEFRKTPLPLLPLLLPSPKRNQLEQIWSDTGSGLTADHLRFKLRNLSGKERVLSLRIRIVDYYGTPVVERDLKLRLTGEREIVLPYRSGTSAQYRAYVHLKDSEGREKTFAYSVLADGPDAEGGRRFLQHLNSGWEIAEIPDDGTLNTRTLQKTPPPDAKFRKTNLPRTWDTHIAFFRKTFRPVFARQGKRFFLHVSRLALEADFYLNGRLVHRHGISEAYAPFEFEVTDTLNKDGDNTLLICARGKIAGSVQANLRRKHFNVESEMRAMNHLMPGFSEIRLESSPEHRLGNPRIVTDFREKQIRVNADLPKGFRMRNRVLFRNREVVPPFGESVRWENPILWGPDSFPLLRLESTVYAPDGSVADIRNTRFGFREIRAEGMNLVWNGKRVRFPGQAFQSTWYRAFMRPDRRDLVRARILELIADGHRCLRHIYGDTHIADIADEEGILLTYGMAVPHGPAKQKFSSDSFWENTLANNLQTIRHEFNHPSIFTWYTGNELFAESEDLHFRRTAPLAKAVQAADPTRFTECGGDLDLHGLLNLISVHYPLQPLKAPDAYPPEMFYWRLFRDPFRIGDKIPKGMIRTTPLVLRKSPIEWGKKPIVINETGWIQYYLPPHGMTAFVGDRIYESPERVFETHTFLNRKMAEGQRDAGVSIITPWKVYRDEDIRKVIPPVSAVLLQEYNSFFTGETIPFDVNLFHDALKKESLSFSWSLTREGRKIDGASEVLLCDYAASFRRRITLNAAVPGVYRLEILFGDAEPIRKTLYFYDRIPLKKGFVVSGDEEIDSRKEQLLRKAEEGETILILPRKDYPSFLPGNLSLTSRDASVNYTFYPDHPVFRGLKREQLSYFYPDHRTGKGYFAKPHQGNFRSLLECGGPDGMNYSALLEVPFGKGRFLYSRLEFDFQRNPVACILYNNIMEYGPERFGPAGLISKRREHDELLNAVNAVFEHTAPADAGRYSALIVDGSADYTAPELNALKKFPGKVLVLNPSVRFGITVNDKIPEALQGRAFRIAEDPLFAGITNGDLFWRRQKRIIHEQDVSEMFIRKEFAEAPCGSHEIVGGARILTCPGFFAARGNMLFTTMDFGGSNLAVRDLKQRILSTLLTSMGVRIRTVRSYPSPQELTFRPVQMDALLDRGLTDEIPDDGKGGWTDQGRENDLRRFPCRESGIRQFGAVLFRIRLPDACFMLASLYRKGGKERVVLPVNSKADALYLLHACAWTSKQHHYSVFVDYSDGSSYEIRMIGERNLRDWRASAPDEPFHNASDTFTDLALVIAPERAGERPASLYKTLWMNPSPEKIIRSLRFESRKKGVPLIFAVTLGDWKKTSAGPKQVSAPDEALFRRLLAEAEQAEKKENWKEAAACYERLIALAPERSALYISLGLCCEKLGWLEKAIEVYERSLERDPNQPDVLQMLSHLKKEKGKKQ